MPETVVGNKSFDALLAELESASRKRRQAVEGFTTRQVAEAAGKSLMTVQRQIRDACRAGAVRFVGKRLETGIDSVDRPVPVYASVKKAK